MYEISFEYNANKHLSHFVLIVLSVQSDHIKRGGEIQLLIKKNTANYFDI